ncbi:unnamed protein product [Phaedon cochleariae]|uniref:Uncharacterized protein n=1 Tax=Phaedon cochleariae TaxID=80249 RepID=A0A9P0DQB6_PHACE|nr:unnamed protein product [Phaedon cochleariae]
MYYQYVEKDTNQVSSAWKVLHALIFLTTFVCSLISAYAFDNLLKNFDHRCILYASPNLELEEIVFKSNSTIRNSDTEITNKSSEIAAQTISGPHLTTKSSDLQLNKSQIDWSTAKKIPGLTDIFEVDDQIWLNNETLSGKIVMKRLGTTFGSYARCSTVLFVPLLSLVVSAVFGAIVVLCGRGGKGYKTDIMSGSWSFVYPVIFVSAMMTILSIIAAIPVNDGLQSFCSNFENFTGQSRCNKLMNYFTLDGDQVFTEFWEMCAICNYSFSFGVLLWTSQISITILRCLRVVDFQFNSISIESKNEEESNETKSQKIHEAVVQAFPGAKAVTQILNGGPEEIAIHCHDQDEVTQV